MEVLLGTHYDDFMSAAVKSGRYRSTDDVVRKAILLLETEEKKADLLREKLIAGENSPMLQNFDSQAFLGQIHKAYL
ncbi:MAG: type II toxin-antitoxin system ParD family antitoxin [Dysgonamonadaceae bacterium]|jgi:putative addiction module CopG family antidote|nr:type II toxin-antitoxin system ParD family antitoxin [Dysgonamonadaceae bacterium]